MCKLGFRCDWLLRGISAHTVKRAISQVEFSDVVAELADIARQREAGVITKQDDLAPLRLHTNELKRELACA